MGSSEARFKFVPITFFIQKHTNLQNWADPFIVRRDGEKFRLVAPAFIPGMMKGEEWPDDENELDKISLV